MLEAHHEMGAVGLGEQCSLTLERKDVRAPAVAIAAGVMIAFSSSLETRLVGSGAPFNMGEMGVG